jgi:DNA-binding transcriptional ArsR family regulator
MGDAKAWMDEGETMVDTIAEEFQRCQPVLTALGDENRQHLILEMMRMGSCQGVRVGQITETTNLSRPAVSHHLKILREAGLIKMRREGTRNYYYFDTDPAVLGDLQNLFMHVSQVMELLPQRGEADG